MKHWLEMPHVVQTVRMLQDESDTNKTYPAFINPLTTYVPHHIETSQLICIANWLAGFYMMGNTGRYCVKKRCYGLYFHHKKSFTQPLTIKMLWIIFLSYQMLLNFCIKSVKGMLQPIFCIDVNIHSDRKWEIV